MKFVLGLLLATAAVVSASASSSHVLYTRSVTPQGWSITGPTQGHESIQFMVALKQRNLHVLEHIFWEVSDPHHANYQNFMTPSEIMSIIAPEPESVQTVRQWLNQHGCTNIQDFGDALEVYTTVDIASQLFSTTFHHFVHEDGSVVIRQWGDYSIPSTISQHVDMIAGVSTFPIPHYKIQRPRTPSPVDSQIEFNYSTAVPPQTLYSIYQVREETMAASNQTSQAVIEFSYQSFSPSDLTYFAQQCNISAQPVLAANIIGPNNPNITGSEAELDIQLMATVNIESTNWFWLEDGLDGDGWLYTFGVHFFNTSTVPQVVSISYGWWEGDQCAYGVGGPDCSQLGVDSQEYVARVNIEFIKIGLRGVSIVASSGDSGANGRSNVDCAVQQLRPEFPGSSPYVTSVGATQLNNAVFNLPNPPPICSNFNFSCPSSGDEVAVSFDVALFATGGGFSMYSPRPSYQSAAVNGYLASGVALPPASYYNSTGRGFPDVAAIGTHVLSYDFGVYLAGGTSASTPIFAALVALLNEIAMEKTGKPLGFMNPLLYQAQAEDPTIFHDVTVGDNKCTEHGCNTRCQGFLASAGWDPVTGLGSLNFNQLSRYVTALLDANCAKKHQHHHHRKQH